MKKIKGISWEQRKTDLENGIDDLLEAKADIINKDVYLLMKELLKSAKVSTSIEEYYEDLKE